MPYTSGPTPLIMAVIIEPEGDPVFGDKDKKTGFKVIPVIIVRSSMPSGTPIGK